jgi:hypothetical membrane protein
VKPFVRFALLAGAIVPLLYFGSQAIAAAFFPDFSVLVHTASVLGSDLSSRPAVLNCGAALTGIAALISSYGLFRALHARGVRWVVVALIAVCSISTGLASLWAASHPLPDPNHNPGVLGAGMFAAPFVVLLGSLSLSNATGLKRYLIANVLVFFLVAALYAGFVPIDLRLYGGAVQRLGALVMLLPVSVLCLWLLKSSLPHKPQQRATAANAAQTLPGKVSSGPDHP